MGCISSQENIQVASYKPVRKAQTTNVPDDRYTGRKQYVERDLLPLNKKP